MMKLEKLVRTNIWKLVPYSSARKEHKNVSGILLDANENSIGSVLDTGLNRYPDPDQRKLKLIISEQKKVNPEQVFIGNGSDEAIDLLIRAFCNPAKDKIIIFPPTYGVYEVFAKINNTPVLRINQSQEFSLNTNTYKNQMSDEIKLTFICDPNNPSGNCYLNEEILAILHASSSIVIIDEAYIDFAARSSWVSQLEKYPNLVVLQTLSKAWGLAGIRIGMAFASLEIIQILNNIKYPYNVNQVTQNMAIEALGKSVQMKKYVQEIIEQRRRLESELHQLNIVTRIYPSDANFLLVRFENAAYVYKYLLNKNIIVRDRSNQLHCDNCLRITIGTKAENDLLLTQLKQLDT